MEKWADYLISSVRYNSGRKHIADFKVHEDKGNKAGEGRSWPRKDVVESIGSGKTFVTVYKENDKWKKGQKLYVIKVKGVSYLKTVENQKEEDNLENLPEF